MIGEIQINPPLATYHNQAKLTDLRRINFIFGSNGTGKTTIARVIAGVYRAPNCQLQWQGNVPLECMVYNRDFVDRNFNQDGPLQGVFTLGEDQVEAEQKLNELRPKINKVNNEILNLKNQLDGSETLPGKLKELADLESRLRDNCWGQKKRHDAYFQNAFSGLRNNAERFKEKTLYEQASNTAQLQTLEDLQKRAETVFSSKIDRVALLIDLSVDDIVSAENNALLQKVISGNKDVDIAALISHLGNSDWVRQGLKYHEQVPDTCPFCQQPTDNKFADNLAEFFNDSYDKDIQSIKSLLEFYHRESDHLLCAIHNCTNLKNPFLNTELFSAEAQALTERLKGNQAILNNKLEEPSRKVTLEPILPITEKLQQLISDANNEAISHNKTVENITTEKQTLTSQVWRYILNELSDDLKRYMQTKDRLTRTISGMEKSLSSKKGQLRKLEEQVKALEWQTTSIQPTINAINDLLQRFGFYSFSLGEATSGRHYRIIRTNGEDASRSLSEGEKTFITFLYFYHLIKGSQSPSGITANRVVVFDDPISSLDSDILYIVSSLIKEVIEQTRDKNSQIKQVFVLTHNVYFHKEISFNRNRPIDRTLNEESFWLVKKLEYSSVVERCETNPIRSSYELLWEDVKAENISSLGLQNTLRRILENYFTMWGGLGKDEICAFFDGRDKLICQSLFSWVNDGSHSIHDDIYINQGAQTNKVYLRVFRSIFDKAGQIGHYNMMTRTSEPPSEQ